MKVQLIFKYENAENTYVVYDENTRDAVIIDPGADADDILSFCKRKRLKVYYVLITHCHYDHILSLEEVLEKTQAKLAAGKYGSRNVGNPDINLTDQGLWKPIQGITADVVVEDGGILRAGALSFKCIYTPGHTNCGVCWLIEDKLFAGDTLFRQNVGRWDLPTGNYEELKRSLREKIYTLDDSIKVFPGHGGDTTIGYEKRFNLSIPLEGEGML